MRAVIRRAVVVVAAAAAAAAVPAAAASAAQAPAVSWSQGGTPVTSYDYGTVNAGSSADRTFTLANSGGAATAALMITVSGPGFSIPSGGDRCTGTSLGPRKSCTVTVRYAPAGAGQHDTGALTATSPKIKASLALHGASNTVTVTSPGNQTSTVGTAVSLPISASDTGSGLTLTYSATGLPAGLSINSSTGQITGTPTTAATSTVTVTAQDTDHGSGSASFTWTVNPAVPNLQISPGTLTSTANGLNLYSYDFGQVASASQTFTVTNTGSPTDELALGTQNSDGWVTSNDTCTDTTLAHGGTCTFEETWTSAANSVCSQPAASGDVVDGPRIEVLSNDVTKTLAGLTPSATCP